MRSSALVCARVCCYCWESRKRRAAIPCVIQSIAFHGLNTCNPATCHTNVSFTTALTSASRQLSRQPMRRSTAICKLPPAWLAAASQSSRVKPIPSPSSSPTSRSSPYIHFSRATWQPRVSFSDQNTIFLPRQLGTNVRRKIATTKQKRRRRAAYRECRRARGEELLHGRIIRALAA